MRILFVLLIVATIVSCAQREVEGQTQYPARIGDIAFDETLDDPEFIVCDSISVLQHYSRYASEVDALYQDEKVAMVDEIKAAYTAPAKNKQSGYITTRFIVNCNGVTGRYRVEEMSLDYKLMKFDKKISGQIEKIIKDLKGWQPINYKDRDYDYYMYLSIHIEAGKIINIMP